MSKYAFSTLKLWYWFFSICYHSRFIFQLQVAFSHTIHNHMVTKCAVQRWEKAQNVLKFNIKRPQGWVKKLRSLLYSLDRKVDTGAIQLWFTFHLNACINFTQWIDSLPVPWFAWTSERKKITRPWVSFKLLAIVGNKHN